MEENRSNLEVKEDDLENTFQKAYGWYLVANRIVGNNFKDLDYVFQKNILEVLNQLQFLIEFDMEQQRVTKKAQGII